MADFHLSGGLDIKFHHKSSEAVIEEERTVFDVGDLTYSVCLRCTAQKYVATDRVYSVLSVKSK